MTRRSTAVPVPEPAREARAQGPFPYADYARARDVLSRALTGPPFYGTLQGPSGMGKSTLLRELVDGLDLHRTSYVYLSSTRASITNIVRFLARALRVAAKRSNLETLDEIASAIRGQQPPRSVIVFVDEADRLTADTLQEFRVISECQLLQEPLFSVVLSGLPGLTELLDSPVAFPLKRRITVQCTISGLRRDELGPYLEHRFPSDARRVPASAHDELFERTQATPGLIMKVLGPLLANASGRLSQDDVHAALDQADL